MADEKKGPQEDTILSRLKANPDQPPSGVASFTVRSSLRTLNHKLGFRSCWFPTNSAKLEQRALHQCQRRFYGR